MFETIDLARFGTSLGTPGGWIALAVVIACLGFAWLFDRALRKHAAGAPVRSHAQLQAGLSRIVFPLTALLLLVVARFAMRHYHQPPFLIDAAVPLLAALAGIRMIVYAMRQLFASQAWLKTGERAIALSIWGIVVLYFVGVLPDLADELDAIRIPVGRSEVTLLTLGNGVLAVVLTLIVTLWLSGLIEQRLQQTTAFDTNTKAVLAKFVRAVLLIVGVLVALEAIGFDLTLLTVFGGALGVGIGLGLQKLAANYIAGFTILLDRSIRLGDMITVDGRYGEVARVTSRYVVLKSLDGVEAIVPNETLVTTTVLNHSYTTRDIRIGIAVQIAYDSDVDVALRLLEEAARAEPRVLKDRNPPMAFLVAFADNGINLELGYWIGDPENGQLNLKSALNRRVYNLFKANGIAIPYPRRDVRLVDAGGADLPSPVQRAPLPPAGAHGVPS